MVYEFYFFISNLFIRLMWDFFVLVLNIFVRKNCFLVRGEYNIYFFEYYLYIKLLFFLEIFIKLNVILFLFEGCGVLELV